MAFYRCGGGTDTSEVTATAEDVLSPKVIVNADGDAVTGTMTNQGAKTTTLSAGGSYTIPKGYHNGNGKVTADSLANQTSATATADQILYNQTAYVNGSKVTGTMTNQGAKTATLNAGGSYTIPKGYHNGSGKVTANSLASQTSATATADKITKGYTAWVNGSKITGTNASVTINGSSITSNTNFKSVTRDVTRFNDIPYKFWDGSAVVYNNAIHILGSEDRDNRDAHYRWAGYDWIRVSTLPYQFWSGSAVVYNNEIHILGSFLKDTNHYKDNGIGVWSKVSTLPYQFWDGSAVVYNNEIHILGGSSDNHYKWNGSRWSKVSTLPYKFSNGSAVVYNNEIHILGSTNSNEGGGECDNHYKWNGSRWSKVSTLPYKFWSSSAVVCDSNIYILGGGRGTNSGLKNFYRFNGSSWSSVMTLPYDFERGGAVVFEGATHILGGYSSDSERRHCELASTKYYI